MNNKSGFTLIEVLIAALIMVSVLGSLAYGLSKASNLVETARGKDIALSAAQKKLEEMANSNLSQIIVTYHNQYFPVTGLTAPSSQPNPGFIDITEVTANELFDVIVTVSWQQAAGRQISRTLNTTLVNK